MKRAGARARARSLPRQAGLAVAALLAALALAELGWRTHGASRSGPTTNPLLVEHDGELGWRYRPLARARHRTDEFEVEVAIDAAGFRVRPGRMDGSPRAILLGDSYAFGWGVAADEAIAAELERRLGAPVLGAGVSGYATDQELLLLRRLARERPDLRPAVVVVLWCDNDLGECARAVAYGKSKPRFELRGGVPVLAEPPEAPLAIEAWSALARSIAGSWRARRHPSPTATELTALRPLAPALMRALSDEAGRMGARFAVAAETADWVDVFQREVPGALVIDLGPALERAERETGPVRFALDGHWNASGHRAAAEAVAQAILASGWLAPGAAPAR
jgi:lysophospholipase L1-like esterase